MRIAITLKYLEGLKKNLFTNGLYQNIFTLYKIIEKIGYEPLYMYRVKQRERF